MPIVSKTQRLRLKINSMHTLTANTLTKDKEKKKRSDRKEWILRIIPGHVFPFFYNLYLCLNYPFVFYVNKMQKSTTC